MVDVTEDIPSERLRVGDAGAVVHIYRDGFGYVVEFTNEGEELRLADLTPDQVRLASSAP